MSTRKNWQFGGIVLPKRGRMTEKAFIKEFINMNERQLRSQYDYVGGSSSKLEREAFAQRYPTLETFVEDRTRNIYQSQGETIRSALMKATIMEFGEELARFRNNLIQGMHKNGIYNDFVKAIGESLDINKMNYLGDGVYQYVTQRVRCLRLSHTLVR